MRADSSGPKRKVEVMTVWGCCCEGCGRWVCCCCSRSFSTCALRRRSSIVCGDTMVTVFFSLRGVGLRGSASVYWPFSKEGLDGEGRRAGDVFDRRREVDGRGVRVAFEFVVVAGKRVKTGDFVG